MIALLQMVATFNDILNQLIPKKQKHIDVKDFNSMEQEQLRAELKFFINMFRRAGVSDSEILQYQVIINLQNLIK